jgi:hypothetical protein
MPRNPQNAQLRSRPLLREGVLKKKEEVNAEREVLYYTMPRGKKATSRRRRDASSAELGIISCHTGEPVDTRYRTRRVCI